MIYLALFWSEYTLLFEKNIERSVLYVNEEIITPIALENGHPRETHPDLFDLSTQVFQEALVFG